MTCAKAVPLYVQLKEHVLQNIRSGEWRSGERVPSEHELVRKFKVSRMTANRALRELMRSGVLARIAGVGTFVGDLKAAAHPLQIRNIAQEIRDRGHRHRALPVTLERICPDATVRSRLGVAAQALHVFHSLIVHFENDVALQVEDRFVNPLRASQEFDGDDRGCVIGHVGQTPGRMRRHGHVIFLIGRRGNAVDARRMGEQPVFRHERRSGHLCHHEP